MKLRNDLALDKFLKEIDIIIFIDVRVLYMCRERERIIYYNIIKYSNNNNTLGRYIRFDRESLISIDMVV